MSENYARTLRWVFEMYLRHSHNPMLFELTTEVGPLTGDTIKEDVFEAGAILRDFANQLFEQYHFPFTMDIRISEGSGWEMNHDRFIFTDQIKIQIGRGFDLLDGQGCIRDTVISVVEFDKAGEVEERARRLRPLRIFR